MKTVLTILMLVCMCSVSAQTPDILWRTCSGKTETDAANGIVQLKNGNYIVAGQSDIAVGQKGGMDFWAVELDKSGQAVWEGCFGGSLTDQCYDVIAANDGGFLLVGETFSSDGDITNAKGSMDCWVVKVNENRVMQWQRTLGGSFTDRGIAGLAVDDGGFLIAAITRSKDGDVTGLQGYQDVWLVKLDAQGGLLWEKCYGGLGAEDFGGIAAANDGGLVITGAIPDNNSTLSSYDVWLLKIDNAGAIEWQKTYGGSNRDYGRSVKQTDDGGYILLSTIFSKDGDITSFRDTADIWLVKLDDTGRIEWEKTFGGSDVDYAKTVVPTEDGYILLGNTQSTNGDVIGNHGMMDYWVIKTHKNGQPEWRRLLGGANIEWPGDLIRNMNGEYIITGATESSDGDIADPLANDDFWTVALGQFPTSAVQLEANKLRMYPSVTTGTVHIDAIDGGDLSVRVYDMMGRTVPIETAVRPGGATVTLLTEVPGTYMMHVKATDSSCVYTMYLTD